MSFSSNRLTLRNQKKRIRLRVVFIGVLLMCTAVHANKLSDEVRALLAEAERGSAEAQFRVANAYDTGQGAPRDGKEAMRWYVASAKQGNAEAQNSVGSGLQAEQRFAEALLWYEKAAAQSHPLATNNLAFLYDAGKGTTQDRRKAYDLYMKAADLGWAESMFNIAVMHAFGQIGEKDVLAGCVWANRAKKFGSGQDSRLDVAVTRFLSGVVDRSLSAQQVSLCLKSASEWIPASKLK
jgi:uncharacterized protein